MSREDVDFSEATETDWLAMEDDSFYPPHLRVFFTSSLGSAPLSGGTIEFSGATKPLVYDISLDVSAPGTQQLTTSIIVTVHFHSYRSQRPISHWFSFYEKNTW